MTATAAATNPMNNPSGSEIVFVEGTAPRAAPPEMSHPPYESRRAVVKTCK